jgi:hypothetical protein
MKPSEMIHKYVAIRDAKKRAQDAFKLETERMNQALAKLEALMLEHLDAEGAESVKTEFGTVFKKTRSSCSVKDRDAFYQFAVDTGNLGAIDMKANAKAVRELLEKGVEVPGVNFNQSIEVGVRRKSNG